MKIANTKAIRETLAAIVNIRKTNAMLGQAFTGQLANGMVKFDEKILTEQAGKFVAHMKNSMNVDLTEDKAILTIVISQMLKNSGVQRFLLPEELTNEIIENGRVFHEGELENNPYYRDVKLGEHSLGRFTLTKGTYEKYQF